MTFDFLKSENVTITSKDLIKKIILKIRGEYKFSMIIYSEICNKMKMCQLHQKDLIRDRTIIF